MVDINLGEYPYPVCPYYKDNTGNSIKCQSPIPDSQCIVIWYANKQECSKQMRYFCNNVPTYKRCEIYRATSMYGTEPE